MFIVDEFGVQEMYKLRFWHGHSTGASGPKKAVLEFTRESADIFVPFSATTELAYDVEAAVTSMPSEARGCCHHCNFKKRL